MAVDFETPEDIAQKIGEFRQYINEQNYGRSTVGKEVAYAFHYDPALRPWQQRAARLKILITGASACFYAVLRRQNHQTVEMAEIDLSPVYAREQRDIYRMLAGNVRGQEEELRDWVREGAIFRVSEAFYALYHGLEEDQLSPGDLSMCVEEAYGLNGFDGWERPLGAVIKEERTFGEAV